MPSPPAALDSPHSGGAYAEVVPSPPPPSPPSPSDSGSGSPVWRKVKELYFDIPGLLCGAVLGILLGYLLQRSSPSAVLVSWIGTPGRLFIRSIQCLVGPLIFCCLVVGMADMLSMGKASSVGWRTALLYLTTTAAGSCEGLIWVLIFRNWFGNKAKPVAASTPEFAFHCQGGSNGTEAGYLLMQNDDGSVFCAMDSSYNATEGTISSSALFTVSDINGAFATNDDGFVERSLTEAVQGQLDAIVPSNITTAFADATLLSIIAFAVPFGIAISLLPPEMTVVARFFREINAVFMHMINWIILCMPVAIISLLASSISGQDDLGVLVSDVGTYVLCALLSLTGHVVLFYPSLLRFCVKCNPYAWLKSMSRALLFAFGSSSSMATLPVVIECMDDTGVVTKTLSRFVLSLGATIGMDGASLVYPIAIVFMAEAEGLGDLIGSVEFVLIILVSTIGAVGAGPVPSAGAVMVITIWSSVFPSVPLPSTFAFIVATDWFIDRFQTVVNVACDTVVCRIVAEQVGETIAAGGEAHKLDDGDVRPSEKSSTPPVDAA